MSNRVEVHPYIHAVRMEVDRRVSPADFARRSGIGTEELRARYGASGLIRCGEAVGSGQLTLRHNLITTAAHVFYNKEGRLRSGSCTFEPIFDSGSGPVAIDLSSIKAGSAAPYDEPATRDWAVAQLAAPIPDATPYQLTPEGAEAQAIIMLAGGNGSGPHLGTERCATRGITDVSKEGIREVAIDCSAGHGSSGAALIDAANDTKMQTISAIYVGYRSVDPEHSHPFSASHYNFAVTIDGPFRRTLLEAASGHLGH